MPVSPAEFLQSAIRAVDGARDAGFATDEGAQRIGAIARHMMHALAIARFEQLPVDLPVGCMLAVFRRAVAQVDHASPHRPAIVSAVRMLQNLIPSRDGRQHIVPDHAGRERMDQRA